MSSKKRSLPVESTKPKSDRTAGSAEKKPQQKAEKKHKTHTYLALEASQDSEDDFKIVDYVKVPVTVEICVGGMKYSFRKVFSKLIKKRFFALVEPDNVDKAVAQFLQKDKSIRVKHVESGIESDLSLPRFLRQVQIDIDLDFVKLLSDYLDLVDDGDFLRVEEGISDLIRFMTKQSKGVRQVHPTVLELRDHVQKIGQLKSQIEYETLEYESCSEDYPF